MNSPRDDVATVDEVVSALQSLFTEEVQVRSVPVDETFVTLPAEQLRAAVSMLVDRFDIRHLSTITADDLDEELRLHYHFWQGVHLTLVIGLPHRDPQIASLTDTIPGAAFYEREIYGMFGVDFEGHAGLEPLLLPDDWQGGSPMRRDGEEAAVTEENVESEEPDDE